MKGIYNIKLENHEIPHQRKRENHFGHPPEELLFITRRKHLISFLLLTPLECINHILFVSQQSSHKHSMASPAIMERRDSITSLSPSPPYSISLPLPPLRRYDVFLSHRANDDTGRSFTSNLHEALTSQGIVVFIDKEDEEDGGKPLTEKMKAVDESRSSIVVFSENYGSWVCMKEIRKIRMCQKSRDQLVLPIFYKVDPGDVRKQEGESLVKFFNEHEANPNISIEEVKKWRKSMNKVGNLSGWHLQDSQLSNYSIFTLFTTFFFFHFNKMSRISKFW